MHASLELQRGIATALRKDAVISALGLEVYDGPPVDASVSYLSIGEDAASFQGWVGGGGLEHRFAVTLWDRREGFAAVKGKLAEVERVILAMSHNIGEFRLVRLRLVRGTVQRTKQGWIRGVLEFLTLSVRRD